MAILSRLRGRTEDRAPTAAISLDIGTEYVKALVFRIEDEQGIVVGTGRHRQGLGQMQAATVTDIGGVVENSRAALRQAEQSSGLHPSTVIIGIAGELVKGFTTSHSQERRRADAPITQQELDKLIEGVQHEAMVEAERSITWETGLPNVDVRLVHAAVTGAAIDGYPVTNPVGFKGRHVRISVFNAFAPLIHLGALQTVARRLDRQLLAVVAEPYAVARCMSSEEIGPAGALFVDVGGGTTDVALVRQGGVEGTRMFALGGRAFTKSISDRLGISFEEAEQRKVAYATGEPVEDAEAVGDSIAEDVAVWSAGVELILEEFGRHGQLPPRIELCGGGSRLPQLAAALRDPAFGADLPFVRPPAVGIIEPSEVRSIVDRTGKLVDQQDVTPMALAVQVLELTGPEDPLDAALKRVLRGMRV
ncbi:MAG: rod shape-determining protein [Chloroflexi bacterium]|nr:rod shape-determining protein [Chloroflexota bacterium]